MSSNMSIRKLCIYCHSEFIAKTTFTKYCSHTCNRKHYKVRKKQERLQGEVETQPQGFTKAEIKKTHIASALAREEFLNVTEACTLLRISRATLYNLINQGIIRKHKLNARTLFKRSELEAIFN